MFDVLCWLLCCVHCIDCIASSDSKKKVGSSSPYVMIQGTIQCDHPLTVSSQIVSKLSAFKGVVQESRVIEHTSVYDRDIEDW